jgi:hypothetical protein
MLDNPYFPYLQVAADVLAAGYSAWLLYRSEDLDRKIITSLLTLMWVLLAIFMAARWPIWH